MLDGKDTKDEKRGPAPDHDSIAGPLSFDGATSWDDENNGPETGGVARARYSFEGEVRFLPPDLGKSWADHALCAARRRAVRLGGRGPRHP